MTRVLIADSFPEEYQDRIREIGCEVDYRPSCASEEIADAVAQSGIEILVVRSTRVTADVFRGAPSLQLVIRAGAGVNTIDLEAASAAAVRVANCPGTNAAAVAELAVGLLIALDRRIPDNVADLRAGRWNKKGYSAAAGLSGRTLGVIGTGSIGKEVIARARAFDMKIVAWSRSLTGARADELGVERATDAIDVARRSDAVTVHLAATPETKGLLGSDFFGALKEGALFINTSRAAVVDDGAMRRAVAERGVRVALDVFDGEPSGGTGEVDAALFSDAGIYGTHHIGASTQQAQDAVAAATVERIAAFVEGSDVPSIVNVPDEARPTADTAVTTIEIRHRNRVGVLAHALTALERAGINVRGMGNQLFDGEDGALARIQVEPEPDSATVEEVAASHDDILAVRVSRRG